MNVYDRSYDRSYEPFYVDIYFRDKKRKIKFDAKETEN